MNTIITTLDGSHSLSSDIFQENYHSTNGAVSESRHVFIEAGLNHVLSQNKNQVNILEIGFGTGLNAFLTLIESEIIVKTQNIASLHVQYCGIEAYPIDSQIWKNLNYPEILNFSPDIFHQLHEQTHSIDFITITPHFSFSKIITKVEVVKLSTKFDLIYFDAFAPTTQPELWSEELMLKMYDCLNPDGVLVTYCAKGSFKRALKSAGFTIERLPGSVGKREMTRAIRI